MKPQLAGLILAVAGTIALPVAAEDNCSPPGPARQALIMVVAPDNSDRDSPTLHPGQAAADLASISAIEDIFQARQAESLFLFSADRLVVSVIPQPTNYVSLVRELSDSLRIDMRKMQLGGKPRFDAARAAFDASLRKLYEAATAAGTYQGADVWGWVRDVLPGYEVPGARNVAILITDGYPYLDRTLQVGRPAGSYMTAKDFESLRRNPDGAARPGLAPIPGLDLSGWEVLLVEVQPRYLVDRPILERLWCTDWLEAMGASCRVLIRQDSTEQLQAAISTSLSGSPGVER